MRVTVQITKALKEFIPRSSIELEVIDYLDILSALKEQFLDFKQLLLRNKAKRAPFEDFCLIQDSKIIDTRNFRNRIASNSTIYIAPLIFGGAPTYGAASSNFYNNMKSSFMYPLFGLSTASYEQMDLEGLHKRVVDSSLFGRAENIYDVGVRENNDIFKGLQLTNSSKSFVPLVYGETRVAGNVINTRVTNFRANPDLFKVSDILNTDTNSVAFPLEYTYANYVDPNYVSP